MSYGSCSTPKRPKDPGYPLQLRRGLAVFQLGGIALGQERYEAALRDYRDSLRIVQEAGLIWNVPSALEAVGAIAHANGDSVRAARLLGAGDALREAMKTPLTESERTDYDCTVRAARAASGEDAFSAAWTEGRAMSQGDAIAYALEEGQA